MELRDLLELLYTAHNRFTSIHVIWNYGYHVGKMHEVRERWAAQHKPGSVSVLKSKSGKAGQDQAEMTVKRQVWWQKPSCWRHEEQLEGQNTIVKIRCQNRWWVFDTANRKLYTNVEPTQPLRRMRKSKRSPEPTFKDFIRAVPLLDPSFLLYSHDLQIEEEIVHAGREVIQVRATSRRGREVAWDSFFWTAADGYNFLVDKERGILLRYAALVGDQAFAVASVENIVFDEPIPDNIFSFAAAASTSIEISS